MKKLKKLLFSPAGTLALFVLAALLLLGSSVGGARAALTYFSETYASRVEMYDIGVTLLENGEKVSWRDYDNRNSDGTWKEETGVLLAHMLENGEELKLGKVYPEELSVQNTGTINQFVRVSIYKYWMRKDENGRVVEEKIQGLSPKMIDLHLCCDATGYQNGWLLDEEASTEERTVLYYDKLLYAEGNEEGKPSLSTAFTDTLKIDDGVAARVGQEVIKENGYTRIITTYEYDGVEFQIEAKVDAVQEHNAQDAIWSAWGRRVTVTADAAGVKTLSLD